jgi:ankyrin repeat protein
MNYDRVSPHPEIAEIMDNADETQNESVANNDDNDGNFCSKLFSCLAEDSEDEEEEQKREEEERRLQKEEEKKKREEEFERKLETMPSQLRLFYFARQGNIEEIKKIPKREIDVNAKDYDGLPSAGVDNPYATHNSAVHFAVLSFNVQCLELVWSLFETPIDDKNKLESTPLHLASSLGCTDIVEWLISKKADTDSRNKIGNTPLHCAVAAGHVETTQTILEALEDPLQSLTEPNGVGMTPEKYAVSVEMQELTRRYLPKSSQNQENNYNNNNSNNNTQGQGQQIEEEPATNDDNLEYGN